MKFCPECDSMLNYIEENALLHVKCNNCGYFDECSDRVIESYIYKSKNINVTNKYAIFDPSLPRTIHKECPNDKCPSRKDKGLQEAVFYPNKNTMELIYICTFCNTQWQYSKTK